MRKQRPESPFERLRDAAARLNLDESTVRQGKAGTEDLTKVYQGRNCFLIRAEVTRHIENLMNAARAQQQKAISHVFQQ